MIREILIKLMQDLDHQIKIQTEELLNNPVSGDGQKSFQWKCGYVCALKRTRNEIENIIKGDAE